MSLLYIPKTLEHRNHTFIQIVSRTYLGLGPNRWTRPFSGMTIRRVCNKVCHWGPAPGRAVTRFIYEFHGVNGTYDETTLSPPAPGSLWDRGCKCKSDNVLMGAHAPTVYP